MRPKKCSNELQRRRRLGNLFTGFTINVPQLKADIDVEKAATLGLTKTDVANALQVNLGSLYVNDFNRFGRTYQVIAQADEKFRKKPTAYLGPQGAKQEWTDCSGRIDRES